MAAAPFARLPSIAMLYADNVSKSFGRLDVLKDVSFIVGDGEHVGLVGANGSGKSTLLALIAGDERPDHGSAGSRGGSLDLLRQEAGNLPSRPLVEELWTAFPEARTIEEELRQVGLQIEQAGSDLDGLIDLQAKLFDRFESLDGYRIEQRIGRVLSGLGFSTEDRVRPCGDFSGGWQMRIALAKLLVRSPDHMLLDEPTNHLDAASRDWLADYLARYRGTALIVTHDADFLDGAVTRILDLRDGHVESYTGNYTEYQRQRAERLHATDQAAARQEREIRRQTAFIDRFRATATRATQAKSRERALGRIERVAHTRDEAEVTFTLQAGGRTEREVLSIEGVSHAYDSDGAGQTAADHIVLLDVDMLVERGQKVVLTGPNGGGKTTLLRIIAGQLTPLEGRVRWAPRARPGYYSQHQDEVLDPTRTVLEEVSSVNKARADGQLRAVLGRFLFTADDIFKRVGVLSGGERSRVALAKFLLEPTNVLLLDEPTNHLDSATRRRLIEALESYDGTIVCASHDPAILERVATRVFEVADGSCRELEELRKDWTS